MAMRNLKNWIKKKFNWESLPPNKRWLIKFRLFNVLTLVLKFFPFSLTSLCIFFGSDKWGSHFYTPVYENIFRRFRLKKINFLEIGVGGYEDPYLGGESIFLWQAYFPFAKLFFIDIVDKTHFSSGRIKVLQGSQDDAEFLRTMAYEAKKFDIIIDDGSHINHHQIKSFETLFPFLSDGGIYVIEDTQTSYWPSYGGSTKTKESKNSCMYYFLNLADELNYGEYLDERNLPNEFNKKITEIHFHHNLIIVIKGNNNQVSATKRYSAVELRKLMTFLPDAKNQKEISN
jgi:hypothetical protein